jgi:hypothetical protein
MYSLSRELMLSSYRVGVVDQWESTYLAWTRSRIFNPVQNKEKGKEKQKYKNERIAYV